MFARSLVLLSLACPACLPSYHLEPRMPPPTPRDAAESCYQDGRVELAMGSAEWTESYGNAYYTVYESHSAQGLGFYRGGEALEPEEALAVLEDVDLELAYQARLDESAGDATWYPIWLTSAFVVAAAAVGLVLTALYLVVEDPLNADYEPWLWSSVGAAGLSIVPTIGAWLTYDGAVEHSRYSNLFSESAFMPRLAQATAAHNRAVASRCGTTAEPEIPASPAVIRAFE
jgi:hypothetical protein